MTGELREYLKREVSQRRRELIAIEDAIQAEHDRAIFERAEQDELRKRRRRVNHPPRTCRECRRRFMPKRSDARFCGAACKQRHFRGRRAA
jgi:hypothetical protein